MTTPGIEALVDAALEEDAGRGDLTSEAIFKPSHRSRARIVAGQALVACGADIAALVFSRLDPRVRTSAPAADGELVAPGASLLRIEGPTIAVLAAERTALNFLQRLCGVATLARAYALAVKGTGVRVADTRKTIPGLRVLEKRAVRCGGCSNHRFSLGEHVLIKDNHIAAAGSLGAAVRACRAAAAHTARIEVEAKSASQVREACAAGADAILLDNMSPARVRQAVGIIARRALVEVSGGIRLETIREYAIPGVDVISVGALTHSAPAADLSLDLLVQRR